MMACYYSFNNFFISGIDFKRDISLQVDNMLNMHSSSVQTIQTAFETLFNIDLQVALQASDSS